MEKYEKLAQEMKSKVGELEKNVEIYIRELDEVLEKLEVQIDPLNSLLVLTESQEDRLFDLEGKYFEAQDLRDRFESVLDDLESAYSNLI